METCHPWGSRCWRPWPVGDEPRGLRLQQEVPHILLAPVLFSYWSPEEVSSPQVACSVVYQAISVEMHSLGDGGRLASLREPRFLGKMKLQN